MGPLAIVLKKQEPASGQQLQRGFSMGRFLLGISEFPFLVPLALELTLAFPALLPLLVLFKLDPLVP